MNACGFRTSLWEDIEIMTTAIEAKLEKELKVLTKGAMDIDLVRQMVKEAKASKTPVMPAQVLGVVFDGVDVPKEKMEGFVKLFLEYWISG